MDSANRRVRAVARLDDDVVSLRHSNLELIDNDRLDVLSIGQDDSHLQAGNAQIEVMSSRTH